jgi:hypothetical protein
MRAERSKHRHVGVHTASCIHVVLLVVITIRTPMSANMNWIGEDDGVRRVDDDVSRSWPGPCLSFSLINVVPHPKSLCDRRGKLEGRLTKVLLLSPTTTHPTPSIYYSTTTTTPPHPSNNASQHLHHVFPRVRAPLPGEPSPRHPWYEWPCSSYIT